MRSHALVSAPSRALTASAVVIALACAPAPGNESPAPSTAATTVAASCREGQAGLTLPAGFCATVYVDKAGAVRHMVVASNGDLFVNMQAARRGSPLASIPAGQLALRDTDGDGRADEVQRFGTAGGTGIALYNGFLYADAGTSIVRYRMPPGQLRPTDAAEVVVSGLPGQPGHISRNFAITSNGTMFVNIGSATNACQVTDRAAGSPGVEGCPELMTRAGIWSFDANRLGQVPSVESRYATGIRNAVAMVHDRATGRLFAVPHGRDNLAQNWPASFTAAQNAELPAEELIDVGKGDDFGWPFCYYDAAAGRRVLAPEYGGDGNTVGRCNANERPLYAFPAHWAPNGMLFYDGAQLPPRYREGVFIAFHGSWNRAPLPQGGYKVVFLPFRDGKPASSFETFADGFAGPNMQPAGAQHRPVGIAQGPDGALYVSDDIGGTIWRITYNARSASLAR